MPAKISNWKPTLLPNQSGKYYVITGGNSGIGLEAALILAGKGANITIACRNPDKAAGAVAKINAAGNGSVDAVMLDLSSMASIKEAAADIKNRNEMIDGLINNAGLMQTPQQKTEDGFELQLGVNHLGHFLWTALLFDRVRPQGGRIVSVSSNAHKFGRIHLDDLMLEKDYTPTKSYCQSKLANMLFIWELSRRLQEVGDRRDAICCHPGYSDTSLQSTGPTGFFKGLYTITNKVLAQSAERGAWPTVLAAAEPRAVTGHYYGPTGFMDCAGPVGDAAIAPQGLDMQAAAKLWKMSEDLIGMQFRVA